jgi:4'-phosphopantetheinyl transferase
VTAVYWLRTDMEHGRSEARLLAAAADYCGAEGVVERVGREGGGKPFFPGRPDIGCSVTHSGGIWLCALSSAPVGADLQMHGVRPSQKIAERFFHPDETALLRARPELFFDVWCAKESYIKYTGEGLFAGLDGFSVVSGGDIAPAVNGAALHRAVFFPGYSLYICGGDGEPVLRALSGENDITN